MDNSQALEKGDKVPLTPAVGTLSPLEEEMARLKTLMQRLADQEKRLIRLFGVGQVTEEFLLREVEQVKNKVVPLIKTGKRKKGNCQA